MTLDGKPQKYQLTADTGDDQEGKAVPIALTDINGDRIETAGGGSSEYIVQVTDDFGAVETVEVLNSTSFSFVWSYPSDGVIRVTASDDVFLEGSYAAFITSGASGADYTSYCQRTTDSILDIQTRDDTGTLAQGLMEEGFFRLVIV